MVKIRPFQALRYDKDRVHLKKAVCPPYDVINRMQRRGYIRESAHNIVRLVLPRRKGYVHDYKKAKDDLAAWIEKGILRYDAAPGFYVYVQESKIDGRKINRCGFFSLLKLEGKKGTGVLPHENVFSKPLFDRANLMKHTAAHLSPIFIVFKDAGARAQRLLSDIVRGSKPESDIYADNSRHRLWPVADKGVIDKLIKCLGSSQTFIADGHHRFRASALAKEYFDKRRKKGSGHSYTLAYLVSSEDKGLEILPTYRAVKVLPKGFNITYMKDRLAEYFDIRLISAKAVRQSLKKAFKRKGCAFVIYYRKRYMLITLKDSRIVRDIGPKDASLTWKMLDVSILHNLVFGKLLKIREKAAGQRNIYYYKGGRELIKKVNSGQQKLGVFLNPSTMNDVITLAGNNEKMPHKSTYFYPKPLTGLVIHKF